MSDPPDFKKFVFPIVRRRVPEYPPVPLRRSFDYQSMLFDVELPCSLCKEMTQVGAERGCRNCMVRNVMES